MGNNQLSVLLSVIYVLLLWRPVQSASRPPAADVTSADQEDQRPLAVKRSVQSCDISFANFCLNNGQCMFLVDTNKNACQCELGYHGARCEQPQLVTKPMTEDQVALIIVTVFLVTIGLAGALYFFCKWYRRNRLPQQQKRWGYRGVQTA